MNKGHCLCGAVSWEYSGAETWACYCHCDDCCRNCAAPVVAYIGIPLKAFKWTGSAPKGYASSPGVTRHFCGDCGTPMAFQAEHYEGEIHVYAASLENPNTFKPKFHVYHDNALEWLKIKDDLPRHPSDYEPN